MTSPKAGTAEARLFDLLEELSMAEQRSARTCRTCHNEANRRSRERAA